MEMRWMPFVFGLIILMTLRSVVFGEMSNVVDLFAVYSYFGVFSIGSFWYRLYQYGHNLDPHAPMHIKPFTPLLIGVKQIANFREYSFPQAGRVSALCFGVADRARRLVFAKGDGHERLWGAHASRAGEGIAVANFSWNCAISAATSEKVRFGEMPTPARCKRALPDYRDTLF